MWRCDWSSDFRIRLGFSHSGSGQSNLVSWRADISSQILTVWSLASQNPCESLTVMTGCGLESPLKPGCLGTTQSHVLWFLRCLDRRRSQVRGEEVIAWPTPPYTSSQKRFPSCNTWTAYNDAAMDLSRSFQRYLSCHGIRDGQACVRIENCGSF